MSQTSEDRKKPFHEVVSSMLLTAPVGLTSDPASGKTEEVVVLLTILQRSKMPAAEAKKTAANHAHLPGLLESVGRPTAVTVLRLPRGNPSALARLVPAMGTAGDVFLL